MLTWIKETKVSLDRFLGFLSNRFPTLRMRIWWQNNRNILFFPQETFTQSELRLVVNGSKSGGEHDSGNQQMVGQLAHVEYALMHHNGQMMGPPIYGENYLNVHYSGQTMDVYTDQPHNENKSFVDH